MHEELSALRTAWLGAYDAPNSRSVDGVSWHDMLDRVLVRTGWTSKSARVQSHSSPN
jgi:hypothetical protein